MSENVDLWGTDFDIEDIAPPALLLKEQAALLGQKTKYIVQADIETSHHGADVVHTFTLIAPALDNYRYMLFRIRHNIDLYPVYIFWNSGNHEAATVKDFEKLLGEILSSESTIKVVKSLLAQSKV